LYNIIKILLLFLIAPIVIIIDVIIMIVAVIDALASVEGRRRVTVDVIGAGPRAVCGVLEKWGIASRILPIENVLKKPRILRKFDILMASGMSVDLPALRKISKIWKNINGKRPTVIGGPITSNPIDAIERAGFDIAVIGEGEETIEELLKLGLKDGEKPEVEDLINVKGIAYKDPKTGKVFQNPLRPIMPREKYDSYIPSTKRIIDYSLFFAARVYVEILRGCSNYMRTTIKLPDGKQCDFCNVCREGPLTSRYYCHIGIPPGCGYCSVPSLYGPPRSRSIPKIVSEIKALLKQGVRRIVLSAPDFLDYGRDLLVGDEPLTDPRNPKPNYRLIEKLLKEVTSLSEVINGEAVILLENMKPNLVDETAAELIAKYLPGITVHIGCETGSEEHAYSLGRPSTPKETYNAIKILKEHNLNCAVYFIYGLPGQNMKVAKETANFMWQLYALGISKITVYRFQPLPMSAFSSFPKGPPSHLDPASKLIADTAEEINRKIKEQYLGKRLRVIVAARYNKMYNVAYPMDYGPVVLVPRDKTKINTVINITVKKVISDKMVYGSP